MEIMPSHLQKIVNELAIYYYRHKQGNVLMKYYTK